MPPESVAIQSTTSFANVEPPLSTVVSSEVRGNPVGVSLLVATTGMWAATSALVPARHEGIGHRIGNHGCGLGVDCLLDAGRRLRRVGTCVADVNGRARRGEDRGKILRHCREVWRLQEHRDVPNDFARQLRLQTRDGRPGSGERGDRLGVFGDLGLRNGQAPRRSVRTLLWSQMRRWCRCCRCCLSSRSCYRQRSSVRPWQRARLQRASVAGWSRVFAVGA